MEEFAGEKEGKAGAESAWQTLGLAVKSAVQRLDTNKKSGPDKT